MIGGTLANRYSRLLARQQALNKINDMFGLNISVRYRDEVEQMATLDERGEDDE
jgi:ppGpp synthetase/RelA/SpoT-type nucleotidyltranferase